MVKNEKKYFFIFLLITVFLFVNASYVEGVKRKIAIKKEVSDSAKQLCLKKLPESACVCQVNLFNKLDVSEDEGMDRFRRFSSLCVFDHYHDICEFTHQQNDSKSKSFIEAECQCRSDFIGKKREEISQLLKDDSILLTDVQKKISKYEMQGGLACRQLQKK